MKVRVTFNVGDAERRAINWSEGKPGRATASEVRGWLLMAATADLEVMTSDCLNDEVLTN